MKKTFMQVVLPIGITAGLIFGITYLTKFTGSGGPDAKTGTPLDGKVPLQFAYTTADRNPDHLALRDFRREYEIGEGGSHTFWFANPNDLATKLRLAKVGCSCSTVELAVVPRDKLNEYVKVHVAGAMFGQSALGGPHALFGAIALDGLLRDIKWRELTQTDELAEARSIELKVTDVVTVPAASGGVPTVGLFRLSWNTIKGLGAANIYADIATSFQGSAENKDKVTVNVGGVPVLGVYYIGPRDPRGDFGDIYVGELTEGSDGRSEFYCVSPTRGAGRIKVSVAQVNPHPCVKLSAPRRLAASELASLRRRLTERARKLKAEPPRVMSAYRVDVKVRAEADGRQLDLGPLRRKLLVRASGPGLGDRTPFEIEIVGNVLGEVSVRGGKEDKNGISLADQIDQGAAVAERTVRLVTDKSGLDLEFLKDECIPAQMEVKLTGPSQAGTQREWLLKVRVPRTALRAGQLPEGAAVVFRVKGTGRRVRVPLLGPERSDF